MSNNTMSKLETYYICKISSNPLGITLKHCYAHTFARFSCKLFETHHLQSNPLLQENLAKK
jgi:hypothetical protein